MTVVIHCPGCNRRIRCHPEPQVHDWDAPRFICQRCGGTAKVARSIEPHPALREALDADGLGTLRILRASTQDPDRREGQAQTIYLVTCHAPSGDEVMLAQTQQEAFTLGDELATAAQAAGWDRAHSTVTHPDGRRWLVHPGETPKLDQWQT